MDCAFSELNELALRILTRRSFNVSALQDAITNPFPFYQLQVGSSPDPMWMFCRNDCSRGMVFAINPPNATVYQAFVNAAMGSGTISTVTSATSTSSSQTPTNPVIQFSGASGDDVFATETLLVSGSPTTIIYASYPDSAAPTSQVPSDHLVQVSQAKQLSFVPSHLTAQPGDTITFQFSTGNHSVVQSTFQNPCETIQKSTGNIGFDSGL